jgi:haloacetate dehalogenase
VGFASEAERAAAYTPEEVAECVHCVRLPGTVRAIGEDYRASATINLILSRDRADREAGRMLATPILVLWGEHGTIERCFRPIGELRRVVREGVLCGHYVAELAPEALLAAALPFLKESR